MPDLALALALVLPPFDFPDLLSAFPDLLPVGEYVGIYVVGSSVVGLNVGSIVVGLKVLCDEKKHKMEHKKCMVSNLLLIHRQE